MKESDIYVYYAFGYNYRLLRAYQAGELVHGPGNTLTSRVDELMDNIVNLDLKVTLQAAEGLLELRGDAEEMAKDSVVDDALATRVRQATDAIDVTLDAELQLRTAFVVTPKRYSTSHLLESPSSLLGQDVFDALPAISQFDFSEATKCIAFNRPTAAAFHLMRCVEGTLRTYYCAIVRKGRMPKLMWHDMLEHLAKRRDAPPKPVMDNLDNIRHNFRNPTQHPEARYDIDEAQDLLAVSIDAINRMVRNMNSRKSSSA